MVFYAVRGYPWFHMNETNVSHSTDEMMSLSKHTNRSFGKYWFSSVTSHLGSALRGLDQTWAAARRQDDCFLCTQMTLIRHMCWCWWADLHVCPPQHQYSAAFSSSDSSYLQQPSTGVLCQNTAQTCLSSRFQITAGHRAGNRSQLHSVWR